LFGRKYVFLRTLWLSGLAGLLVFWAGCAGSGQPSLKVDYYGLEYNLPSMGEGAVLAYVIEVKRFTVSPLLNSERIIYRDKAYRRNEYVYHRWRANPADLVTFYLARDLRDSGRFSGVFALGGALAPTHFLEGAVEGFHEEDGPDGWEGVLSVSITLLDRLEPDVSRRVLLQKKYSEREPCLRKNPEALAEALSQAMLRVSGRISEDIQRSLSALPSGPSSQR